MRSGFRRVFQGSTEGAVYEDFIEQLLHRCGKLPEPKPSSVVVMDVDALCAGSTDAGFEFQCRAKQGSKGRFGKAVKVVPARDEI
jgi:hypothetical protein